MINGLFATLLHIYGQNIF